MLTRPDQVRAAGYDRRPLVVTALAAICLAVLLIEGGEESPPAAEGTSAVAAGLSKLEQSTRDLRTAQERLLHAQGELRAARMQLESFVSQQFDAARAAQLAAAPGGANAPAAAAPIRTKTASAVLPTTSAHRAQLASRIAELDQQRTELAARLQPEHPAVRSIELEMADLRSDLNRDMVAELPTNADSIAAEIESSLAAAEQAYAPRPSTFESNFEERSGQLQALSAAATEAETAWLEAYAGERTATSRVVAAGMTASQLTPVAPHAGGGISLRQLVIVSLALVIAGAIFLIGTDVLSKVRTLEDVECELDLPVWAVLPAVRR